MQTDLYLIRHGETSTNRARLIQGWNNEPLNAVGRAQAERAAARLAGVGAQALYASTLTRAHETALCISQRVGLDVVLVDALRELNTGSVSGLHGTQFLVRYPRLFWSWLRDDDRMVFPNGEMLADFYVRAQQTVDRLMACHQGQAVLVVSHGGIISSYLSLLFHGRGYNRRSLQLRNASISHVRWFDDLPPQLVVFNDTSHLCD